jgi:hypothetical protein
MRVFVVSPPATIDLVAMAVADGEISPKGEYASMSGWLTRGAILGSRHRPRILRAISRPTLLNAVFGRGDTSAASSLVGLGCRAGLGS